MGGIGGFPAALIALVDGRAVGLLRATFRTEFPLVHRTAGACPTFVGWLGRTALGAELAGRRCATGALPAVCRLLYRSGLPLRLLLRAHLE